MKLNVGKIDRALRLALGTALLAGWFFDPGNFLWLLGMIPLATGAISFCPLYQLLGISTSPVKPGIKKVG